MHNLGKGLFVQTIDRGQTNIVGYSDAEWAGDASDRRSSFRLLCSNWRKLIFV